MPFQIRQILGDDGDVQPRDQRNWQADGTASVRPRLHERPSVAGELRSYRHHESLQQRLASTSEERMDLDRSGSMILNVSFLSHACHLRDN